MLLVLFSLTTPWLGVGFWNSVIGLVLMRSGDASAFLIPEAAQRGPVAITASTAILMCVRNEAPDRVTRNLDTMMADLDTEGWAERFHRSHPERHPIDPTSLQPSRPRLTGSRANGPAASP